MGSKSNIVPQIWAGATAKYKFAKKVRLQTCNFPSCIFFALGCPIHKKNTNLDEILLVKCKEKCKEKCEIHVIKIGGAKKMQSDIVKVLRWKKNATWNPNTKKIRSTILSQKKYDLEFKRKKNTIWNSSRKKNMIRNSNAKKIRSTIRTQKKYDLLPKRKKNTIHNRIAKKIRSKIQT